jgi:hypothetical protein
MFVTDATFHLLMSLLNVLLPLKSEPRLVTVAVSQSVIGPYVAAAAVGSHTHAVTATAMLAFVIGVEELMGRSTSSARPARFLDVFKAANVMSEAIILPLRLDITLSFLPPILHHSPSHREQHEAFEPI